MKANIQSFADGIVRLYSQDNAQSPGNAPEGRLTLEYTLRYDERTVGVRRHYEALRAGDRVDLVLRCQRVPLAAALTVAVPNDGLQYRVALIQYPKETEPECMDLTLRRVETDYELG